MNQTNKLNHTGEGAATVLGTLQPKKADYSRRPHKYSRKSLASRELPVSARFQLATHKFSKELKNPHPLTLGIQVGTKGGKTRSHFSLHNTLLIDPANWSADGQCSTIKNDPINERIAQIRQQVFTIYVQQKKAGLTPAAISIKLELTTGNRPEYRQGEGWGFFSLVERDILDSPVNSKAVLGKLVASLSRETSIKVAYRAYVAYLRTQKGTHLALSEISLSRWERGLLMLETYEQLSGLPLPMVGKITVGWGKRYHLWLQTLDGGPKCPKAVSAGQATRFVAKISNVLDWLIEDDIIESNAISRVKWPKLRDKEVRFLEPEHVHQLLQLDWQGPQGAVLWWFTLMCCTGMDYPDAIAYAQNRTGFEVMGRAGMKIVGKRKKPPHVEYNLPLLDEVDTLFTKFPTGPHVYPLNTINGHTLAIEKELGIDWRITAKTARKTFGCLMLAAGHRISDVSLMMGHSNIITTERHYVKVRGAAIDRSMERVKVNISQLAAGATLGYQPSTSL